MSDEAFVDRFMAAWNSGDPDAVAEITHPEGWWEYTEGPSPLGHTYRGRDAVRAAAASMFETLPDGRFSDIGWFAQGDHVLVEWTYSATTPAGRELRARGCDVLTLRDGLVLRKASYLKRVRE